MRSTVGSGAPEPVSFSHGSVELIPVVPSPPPSHSPPDSSRRETLFFTTPLQGPAAAPAASRAGSSESVPSWVSTEQINHIQGRTQLARLLLLGKMIGEDVFTTICTLGGFDHHEGWHFAQAHFQSICSLEQIPNKLCQYLEQEHLWLALWSEAQRLGTTARPQPTSAEIDSSRRVTKSWPVAPAGATSLHPQPSHPQSPQAWLGALMAATIVCSCLPPPE